MWKNAFWALVGLVLVIQFFRPEKNEGEIEGPNHVSKVVRVPEEIKLLLKTSCYDCHSNYTRYPWYNQIMPFGWWLRHHVEEGKEHLNFSEFATYSKERQDHQLEETKDEVIEGEMPLSSYTLIHSDAKLSKEKVEALTSWLEQARKELHSTQKP